MHLKKLIKYITKRSVHSMNTHSILYSNMVEIRYEIMIICAIICSIFKISGTNCKEFLMKLLEV